MSSSWNLRLLLSALLAGSIACGDSDPGTEDAGLADTGSTRDTGVRDTGTADAGRADAGRQDAGPTDQGTNDPDAAAPDGGEGDAGTEDGGPLDDASTPDATTDDAGEADGGPRPDAGPIAPTCNPTLGAAEACGGDPTGTWSYTAACVDPVVFATAQNACPLITVNQLSSTATGTLSLNSDSSFTRTATSTFIYEVMVPSFCAQPLGGCAGVAGYIEGSIPSTRRVANCSTLRNGDCNCSVLVEQVSNDSGTYSVDSANGLITANALEYHYCVIGDALLYKGTTNNNLDRLISNVLER